MLTFKVPFLYVNSSIRFQPQAVQTECKLQGNIMAIQAPMESGGGQPSAGSTDNMSFAIVGMGCRFPGSATSPERLWELLSSARSAWTQEPPDGRFSMSQFYDPQIGKLGSLFTKGAHFLKQDISLFDRQFFNISATEAAAIDPQIRLLLEIAYETFENAGYTIKQLADSKTGVFVGSWSRDYHLHLERDPENAPMYESTGTAASIVSNRISHFFDLKGPSFTVDTACSSSLVALHQALLSLRNGDAEMAFVGGVNLIIDPTASMALGRMRLLSPDGRSFAFDERANGYGRGEGVGGILLKPLDAARRDGDQIRAIVRSSAINQDGQTPGITLPSGNAQEQAIRCAYTAGGLKMSADYVECHGTGTAAGDPIETKAVAAVLAKNQAIGDPLIIGSIKSNIGHLEAAAGIAGIIKSVLMLEKGVIPPQALLQNPTSAIDFEKLNVQPSRELYLPQKLNRISVNSFGFGGANAHVVLEKAPLQVQRSNGISHEAHKGGPYLAALSASSERACKNMAAELSRYIVEHPDVSESPSFCGDLAFTLSRRSQLLHRVAITYNNIHQLMESLDQIQSGALPLEKAISNHHLAFVFTGQGAQWFAMARELLEGCQHFQQSINRAAAVLKHLGCTWDLTQELLKPEDQSRVNEPDLSQPISAAVQISIVDLMRSLCIKPSVVLGHSSGEIAAAYAASAISFEDAVASAYHRGFLVGEAIRSGLLKGAMLAVGLDAAKTQEFITQVPQDELGSLCVACHNSPSSVTVSGDEAAVVHLHKLLQRNQIFSRLVKTNGAAYHSHHMQPLAQRLSDALASNNRASPDPSIRWISSVTALDQTGCELDGEYWVKNLVSPVLFPQALEEAFRHSQIDTIVEIGPHSALAGPIKQTLKALGKVQSVRYTNVLTRNQNANVTFLSMIGALINRGESFDQIAVHSVFSSSLPSLLTDLPNYPWDHDTRYWHESRLSAGYRSRAFRRHALLGVQSPDFNPSEPSWRNYVRLSELSWLKGHAVHGQVIWPGAGFITMAIEAVRQLWQSRGQLKDNQRYRFRDLIFSKAFVLREGADDVEINFKMRPLPVSANESSGVWNEFRVFTLSKNNQPQEHCRGLIAVESDKVSTLASFNDEVAAYVESRSTMHIDVPDFYRTFRAQGMGWREAFAGLTHISASPETSRCGVRLMPAGQEDTIFGPETHSVHPGTLDSLFQASFATMIPDDRAAAKVITGIDELEISSNAQACSRADLEIFCVATDRGFDISSVSNRSLSIQVNMKGFQIMEVAGESSENDAARQTCFNLEWEPMSAEVVAAVFGKGADNSKNDVPQVDSSNGASLVNGTAHDLPLTNGIHHEDNLTNGYQHSPELSAARPGVQLLGNQGDDTLRELTSALRQTAHVDVETESWETASPASNTCIILDTSQTSSLLSTMQSDRFTQFRHLISQATNILWITQCGSDRCSNPGAATVSGFVSTLRVENPALRLVTLDIDQPELKAQGVASLISDVLQSKHFDSQSDIDNLDFDLAFKEGQWLVPRITVNEPLSNAVTERNSKLEPAIAPFLQDYRPLRLASGQPGLLDSLRWEDQDEGNMTPQPDEIIIETRAHGVNFRDLLVAMGQLGQGKDAVMAGECSGIVTAVGSDLKNEFSLGDRVCAFGASPYPNFARVPGHRCIKVPENVSFEVAASIPIVYSTVVYALLHVAQIERSSKVLIHSATGGVGQTAVMLAQHIGAEVFATVGNAEKRKLLIEEYGVADDHIFSSRDTSFKQQIMDITNGYGVDMVLNSLTGEMFRESCNCLANFGHFVEIGKRDLLANSRMEMRFFLKNASFTAMDLMVIGKQKPALCKRLMREAMQLVADGALKSIKITTARISEVSAVFRQMQGGKHVGKMVLTADRDTQVKVITRLFSSTP